MEITIIVLCLSVSCVIASQPHILFMLADDLGYHDVGYHKADINTPNIDKLASNGVILENYYVQPICTPSRSQIMTGRYQIHTGLQHSVIFAPQPHCLPLDEVTLPQKLKEAGYNTHAVGKWHLGFYKETCLPNNRGFDSFYGYYCGNQDYYTKETSIAFDGPTYSGFDFHNDEQPEFSANGTYSAYLYQKRAIEIIRNHTKSKPLFLYLPFQSVYFPLQVPQKYIDMYSHIKDKNRRIFSGMVTAMDDVVGAVINALKEHGMWENTLTIFSADNGGQTLYGGNNWPLRGRKATLWEGGVRGVGIAHGAGIRDSSRISRELMHVSDWFPTLIHVAGGNTNGTKPLDGHNVWDSISMKDAKSPRTELLHNIDPLFTKRAYGPSPPMRPFPNRHGVDTLHGHTALRVGSWKLFTGDPGYDRWDPPPTLYRNSTVDVACLVSNGHHPDCHNEEAAEELAPSLRLYNVEADPEERDEVSALFPTIVDEMLAKLAAYNKTAVPVQWPAGDSRCNPALRGGVWGPWA